MSTSLGSRGTCTSPNILNVHITVVPKETVKHLDCLFFFSYTQTWLSPGFLFKGLHIRLQHWDPVDVTRSVQIHSLQLGGYGKIINIRIC